MIFLYTWIKNLSYDENKIKNDIYFSEIYHTKRINVTWGGFSQIHAELILLLKANDTNHYDHYHLLSGQDLSIQTQENIQSFYLNHSGKEFVSFDSFENFKLKERE